MLSTDWNVTHDALATPPPAVAVDAQAVTQLRDAVKSLQLAVHTLVGRATAGGGKPHHDGMTQEEVAQEIVRLCGVVSEVVTAHTWGDSRYTIQPLVDTMHPAVPSRGGAPYAGGEVIHRLT